LAVVGELDIGTTDLSNNLASPANGATPIIKVEHGGTAANLTDGNPTTRVDTYLATETIDTGPEVVEDYCGVTWATPRHRISAVGIGFASFGDGGWLDDCVSPVRVEYRTGGGGWIPVTGLNKGRFPDMWQRMWWGSCQIGWLFRFDELYYVDAIRVIGQGNSQADGNGFMGCYEFEVFGAPVLAEIVNYDKSSNGDVDATDLGLFMNCWSGATVPYGTGCADRDLDKDGDVDEGDFGIFQRCFSGADKPADPNCG
jgi:hypothetical protein